jgi:hypothetical protein
MSFRLTDDERRLIHRERDNGKANVGIRTITASSVEPANVRWAWRGWVPLGMQSALIGMPGFGKTTFAMLLGAGVTRGVLEGDLEGDPGDVLFVSYEDVIEVRLRPMAEAANADLDRLHFLAADRVGYSIDLTRHLPSIEGIAVERAARLVVVDPLVAGLPAGEINSHRDQDVRSVLAPLAALAEQLDLAVLTTGHFSKSAVSALLGAGGSIGFAGAARSMLVFGPDPKDEQGVHGRGRVLAHAKCNVGRLRRSREVGILPDRLDPFGDKPIETSRAVLGAECDVSADDLVRVDQGAEKESPRDQAARFLRGLLADGPHRAREVFSLAADDGIAEKTLRRAKDDLDVRAVQRADGWWWRLPTDDEREGDGSS